MVPPSGTALAQQDTSYSDSLRAGQLMSRATVLSNAAKNDSSNILLQKAAHLFEKINLPVKAASCYNSISSNYNTMGKLDAAEQHAEKALSLLSNVETESKMQPTRAYTLLGIIESKRANYDQALSWLEKAYGVIDHPSISPVLRNTVLSSLGYVYDDTGNYDTALAYYFEALKLLQSDPGSPKGKIAKLYNNIGYTYSNKGRFDLALEYYKKELALNLDAKGDDHPDVAGAYINVGSGYYRRGAYGEAILHFQKSLNTVVKAYGENHLMAAITYEGMGNCYLEMQEFDRAIENFKKGLEIKTEILGAMHPQLAFSYKNLGLVSVEKKAYRQARAYFKKAAEIQEQLLGKDHPELADSYTRLASSLLYLNEVDSSLSYLDKAETLVNTSLGGYHPVLAQVYTIRANAYLKRGNTGHAQMLFQQSLTAVAPSFRNSNIETNPDISSIKYPVRAVEALSEKASGLFEIYQKNDDFFFLRASLRCYHTLSSLLDELQYKYVSEKSKIVITRESHGIYEKAMQVAYTLYDKKRDPEYLEHMFFFAEKSKAQILRERIVRVEAKAFANIPDSLLEYEKYLKTEIYAIHQKLAEREARPVRQQPVGLRDSLLVLNNMLATHIASLETRYPKYHQLKFSNVIPSTREIQLKLEKERTAVVEYMSGREFLWAIVITSSGIQVFSLPADSYSKEQIFRFNQSIYQQNDSVYTTLGHSLYKTLFQPLEPVLSSYSKLIIVPDGALSLLPFEALLTEKRGTDRIRFKDLPYLVRDYELEYTPSLTLKSFTSHREKAYTLSFLAFAPVFEDALKSQPGHSRINLTNWRHLPFSKNEVIRISSLFSEASGFWSFLTSREDSRVYLNRRATEEHFKEAVKQDVVHYLHLATHAFISEGNTKLTGIVFYPDEHSAEDNILFVNEIYGLSLNAELVVLSACETGTGTVIPGEGIFGLSRAFQYAGANNLLVSLWKVEDRSTAQLMEIFYNYQLSKDNKSWSLQQAKRDLIKSISYSHPKYWAPFILIGK